LRRWRRTRAGVSACPLAHTVRGASVGIARIDDVGHALEANGRNLGLEVVAEGVESEAVWNRLTALGCTVAQGDFLSRPVPPDELRA